MNSQADDLRPDIIAVDDNPVNLRLLEGILTQKGYKVRSVTHGMVALKAAQAKPPDLILLDIMMPEVDGYEICQHLKADERTREIPVIFISALHDAAEKVRAFNVGAVDYIAKPFQMEEVIARIEHQLNLRSLQKQLTEQNARLQQEVEERQRAEEETQLLLNATQAIGSAADFNTALEVALEQVCRTSGWSYGEAWVPNADGTVLECSPACYFDDTEDNPQTLAALKSFRQNSQHLKRYPNEGVVGRVWMRGEPEYVEGIATEANTLFLRNSLARACSFASALSVPIIVPPIVTSDRYEPGRVLAVLVLFLSQSARPKSDREDERLAELVYSVATQLGTVMQQKQTEAELRGLFSAMDDGIRVYDARGRCLKIVTHNTALLGQPDAIANSTLHDHLPPDQAHLQLAAIQDVLSTQQTQSLEYSLPVNNRTLWLSVKISPLSEETVIFVARDITARKQAEEEVKLLLEMSQAISAAPDFDTALAIALQQICETTGWLYGEAWAPATDGTAIECSPSWYRSRAGLELSLSESLDRFREYSEVLSFLPEQGLPGRVWFAGASEWIADVSANSTIEDVFLRLELAAECGLKAAFGVPILVSGNWGLASSAAKDVDPSAASSSSPQPQVLAVLVFFMVEARPQDERLSKLVAAVAAQLGTVLQQKKAEAEMRALLAAMTDVVVVRDSSGYCLKVVPTHSPNWYAAPEEMLGKTLQDVLPREPARLILGSIQTALKTQQTINIEYSLCIGGQEIWFAETISPMTEDTAILVARDITSRKQTEEALRVGEERLKLALEGSALGIWDWNVTTDEIYLSPEWKALLGYKADEIEDSIQFWQQLVHPEDLPRAWEALGRHLEGDTPLFQEEFRMRSKSGEWQWILSHGKVFDRNEAGAPVRMTGTHKDISDRKHVEEALRQSELKFRGIVENANDIIYILTAEGTFSYISPNWVDILGYTPAEFVGQGFAALIHPEDAARCWDALHRSIAQEPKISGVEYRIQHQDGNWRWHTSNLSAVRNNTGSLLYCIGIARDITEKKQAERALKYRAKTEQLLSRISRAFLDRDVDEAIDFTLQALGEYTHSDRSYVLRYSQNQTHLTNTHEWCASGIHALIDRLQNVPIAPYGWLYQPLLQGQVVQIPAVAELPPEAASEREEFERESIQSLIVVPMVHAGKVIGCIGLDVDVSHPAKTWSPEEIQLLTFASEMIAIGFVRSDAERERKRAESALRLAKQQSERLLLNILPRSIAEHLKQDSGSIAQQFDEVTIMFADIVGFTPLSAKMSPIELVGLLNKVFSAFDQLADRHGLEKIKTIGDAYMVVGGLPTPMFDHAGAIAEMALSMQHIVREIQTERGEQLQLRIGINTGTVVAGVIGIKKFIYDLWGDAVNVASRMESQGKAGRIQVTVDTYEYLKTRYTFEQRGAIAVKGRGEMTTYWLTGKQV